MYSAAIVFICIILFILFLRVHVGYIHADSNLPPSPKPLPILGNIRNLPPSDKLAHLHWLRLKDTCGSISSIRVLGTTLVILHDPEAASELLNQQSLKTSSRPILAFAGELCGFERLLTFMQYDSTYRWHRKLIHQQLGTKVAASRFRDIEDVESRRFLLRVLTDPHSLMKHIKTQAGAIILKMTYGYAIEPSSEEPLIQLIERMMDNVNFAAAPMTWAVDVFPILKHLPSWFPGTGFLETARQIREVNRMALNTPFSFVQRQIERSLTYRPSYLSSHLENRQRDDNGLINLSEEEEDALKQTAGAIYGGGADTTVSTLSSFVLAMILFPQVQKKAQNEIDLVVGNKRLPGFEDQDNLPYLNALVKESVRWIPVTPMGIGHVASEEIRYAGFCIPKGAFVLPAVWWFLHDPKTHLDPEAFDPERFLPPRNEPDPTNHAFGYGRRICPGRFVAADSMFITIARMLAVFDITRAVDHKGVEIEPKIELSLGPLSHPLPFPYQIRPRSQRHAELIQSVTQEHPWEKGDSKELDVEAIRTLLKRTL